MRRFALAMLLTGVLFSAGAVRAQTLVANEDRYGVPFGEPLVVGAFGVLDNDLLDGENAGEGGATAELVSHPSYGALTLSSDGSFTYSPGASFPGSDSFVYRTVFAAVSSEATVSLSACTGGPVFTCWKRASFLSMVTELGYATIQEGFEDDAVWGSARSPTVAPSVTSQGVRWQSNHPGPPSFNGITTGSGPALQGQWGVFDPDHGYATGSSVECDIDVPPEHCLFHDGFTGIRLPTGTVLRGVGGFITGFVGANVAIVLDGTNAVGVGRVGAGHRFMGVIDAGPFGFRRFEFRELDGKVGQARLVFGDEFTLAVESRPIPVLSVRGLLALAALLALSGALFWRGSRRHQTAASCDVAR